jgi:hypothetical protein
LSARQSDVRAVDATELRRLEDGREFRIINRSFDPDRLARDLREHDLDSSFVETGEFFVYGLGDVPSPT